MQPFSLEWKSSVLLFHMVFREWYILILYLFPFYLCVFIYISIIKVLHPKFTSAPVYSSQELLLKWMDEWHIQKIILWQWKKSGCIWLIHNGDKDLHIQLWEIISKSPQWTVPDFVTTWWKVIKINLKARLWQGRKKRSSKMVRVKNDIQF